MAEIVRMPALSDTMEEGTLVAWHKQVGDTIESGDLLAEIETDKAVMEFQSIWDGVLLYIGIEEGNAAPVDSIIAILGSEGEDYKAILTEAEGKATNATQEKEAPAEVMEQITAPLANTPIFGEATSDGRIKASPLARAIAKEEGIDLSHVKGTGDDGRIVKRDIEGAIAQGRQKATPQTTVVEKPQAGEPKLVQVPELDGTYEDIPTSQMRKTIARRLSDSKYSAPHFYLTVEVQMDKLMETRKQVNALAETKISFNDFIVKATAKALKLHPNVNASWLGDRIRQYHYINIGVAVAIDEGLIVPVLRHADQKSLSQIASEIRELAGKARDRKLMPSEMQGNTFTISNLGMFGIDEFTAIINSPDACILAVGTIHQKLVLVEGEVKATSAMKITLSCDHRVVDGASGARFLQTLRGILEEPMRLLI